MYNSGTWWLRSESDPRWNTSGTSTVGGFEMCSEAKNALESLKRRLGDPPKDLEHGYMKD
jgi:hypothetical protein